MEIAGTYVIVPLISGACNVLLDRLTSERTRELLRGHDSTLAELSTLKTTMDLVNKMVNIIDPCTFGMQDIDPAPALNNLLNEIKNLVYDTEDLVEQILTEDRGSPSTRHRIVQMVSRLNPSHERSIVKIREKNEKFSSFAKLLSQYATANSSIPRPTPYILYSAETSSFVDESMIVGRDSEREQIFKVLEDGVPRVYEHRRLLKGKDIPLVSVPVDKDIRVIAIAGMPGIGKTTLAQVVFNDPRADHIFNLKAWVYVPQVFDTTQIINKILSLLSQDSHPMFKFSKNYSNTNLELSQKKLKNKVAGKRIMIVLDDLWDNGNLKVTWQDLLNTLKHAAPGSTIIVTTHNEVIVRDLCPILTLTLHELSEDDAWVLFKAHALGSLDERLETVGRKITAKAGGLPLAIVALGRLLRNITSDIIQWETIANSNLWDLPDSVKKEILPALLLSYNYLPQHVKRCFAYCSIFPKNYQFDKKKLVLLWMAEGFLQKPRSDSNRQMEDIGDDYFDALKSQFFFHVSNSERNYFVMHDLIHNLAAYVMGEFGSRLEPNTSIIAKGTLRHLSYKQSKYDTAEKFNLIARADHLRTFLPVGSEASPTTTQPCFYLTISVLQSLESFGYLRVLSLCGYQISNIPPSIGNLQLVCYLDFSFTCIEELPESICDLSNLQTLLLLQCRRMRKLPVNTRKLVNLRHLDIRETHRLQEMPSNIGSLVCLQTLTNFVVCEHDSNSIRELGEFTQLRGSLQISGLDKVANEADVVAADLRGKEHLEELVFKMQCYEGSYQDEKNLNASRPHTNLKRLTIEGYGGYGFPDWVGDEAFFNLEVLHLKSCKFCRKLPSLGHLPSLKHLLVVGFPKLETVGLEFYGQLNDSSPPFKSLVTLEFNNLSRWKMWTDCPHELDPFPCLEKLTLSFCPELEGRIPSRLPSLVDLDIDYCPKFVCYLPWSRNLLRLKLLHVKSLDISDPAGFTCLTSLSVFCFDKDTLLASIKNVLPLMTSLENLTLRLHPGRPDERWNLLSSIRSIDVNGCFREFDAFIEGCEHLQYLHVKGFDSRIEFPLGHSQVLNYLHLDSCSKLEESLILAAGDDSGLESLYDLSISWVRNVNLFRFPARNLTTLSLVRCTNLRTLPNGMAAHFPCLQFLCIDRCPLSGPFPQDDLPPNLQTLLLEFCEDLQFLSETLSLCTSLQRLSISCCSNLVSLPAIGLPPNLQELKLMDCPKIDAFPQHGLPPDLRLLSVNVCEGLIRNYTAWQLNKLTSLQELQIIGNKHEEFFPANGLLGLV